MSEAQARTPFQDAVYRLLVELDPEPDREGMIDTPKRVEEAFRFYCKGYGQNPREEINTALYEPETDEMVLVKNIEIYSLCEHHLAPFFGKAHVAYIPRGKIVGLSKVARLVDVFARRLQRGPGRCRCHRLDHRWGAIDERGVPHHRTGRPASDEQRKARQDGR